MVIQALKDIVLGNGMTLKAGGVLNVPDQIGAALIDKGLARLRVQPGPAERKTGERDIILNPGDPLPPVVPHVRIPAPPVSELIIPLGAYEDQDNFIRDLVTIAPGAAVVPWGGVTYSSLVPPVPPSESASLRPPVLTLDQIKLQCRIELDQTDEDELLTLYEMAARIHAENILRYQIDDTVAENVKQACLMLIAHWYRNREATGGDKVAKIPLAYKDLLHLERDFPNY
jgi:uncharacterized phage protein (predicted DNA packaging)